MMYLNNKLHFARLATLLLCLLYSHGVLSEPAKTTIDSTTTDSSTAEPAVTEEQPVICVSTPASQEFVDRLRNGTRRNMCRTAAWVDGLFGDEHQFDDSNFSGKLSLGFTEDETEGFDPRVRVRFRTKLPNVSSRLNAFLGRVEEDSFISETEVTKDRINNMGLRSTNDDDSEWLFGLGYRNPNSRYNGFDYSIGAKLSGGFNPYAKITHRHLYSGAENRYWRTKQTLFWRNDEKLGFSSQLDYTRILNDVDIVEWEASAKYTEESEQWEWLTSASWHHSFTRTRGISSRIYVLGEEKNPVSIPEYGLSFTYIREFLRPWLFIETGIDLRWEKDQIDRSYNNAIRVGVQLEMLLGDYYAKYKKK